MKFRKSNVTRHFEIDQFDGVGIELVLPQSRTPALEKKKEILHGYRTSAPALPHSAHGLYNEVY